MKEQISPEFKKELLELANNVKKIIDNYDNDVQDRSPLLSTGVIPKFLNDTLKEKLALVQSDCDFDISSLSKRLNFRGPNYDLTSDIKYYDGKVIQSFVTGSSYTEDFEELPYHQGYASAKNAEHFIKENMPILHKALVEYKKGYENNTINDIKAYDMYCKNNNVDADALYNGDLKSFEVKNEAIKNFIKHGDSLEFVDKEGFDKVCKKIEKDLKEHFIPESKNKNKNKI